MIIAGVDEVGRGPLVGDVVAAAVILAGNETPAELTDSKKLTEKKRQVLFQWIQENAMAIGVGRCSPTEIDHLNILQASLTAMHRAVDNLAFQPEFVYVDGNKLPSWPYAAEAVVGGDGKIAEISAASIIAKVIRDEEMYALDRQFPQYGFAQHKGYPTKAHLAALADLPILPHYRRSFKPVQALVSARESE